MCRCINQITATLLAFALLAGPSALHAEQMRIAVAANFMETARELAEAFSDETGHEVGLSSGSTGQLYAQIKQGAPYDVFLAADAERPLRAIEDELAVSESLLTYAFGTLVLASTDSRIFPDIKLLQSLQFRKLAIANPATAPYGKAAMQALESLNIAEESASRLIRGNSIAQTWQFVFTGNADMGFVALSQIPSDDSVRFTEVPPNLYEPIRQDAVLLTRGKNNVAALAFMTFLQSKKAAALISSSGYRVNTDHE